VRFSVASRAHEVGDDNLAMMHLGAARGYGAGHAPTAALAEEIGAVDSMLQAFEAGDDLHARKLARFRSYRRQAGRATPPVTDPNDPGAGGPPALPA